MRGQIKKALAGFYYVENGAQEIYQCRARGIFRKENLSPLVGDLVEFSITDEKDMEGNVEEILPRHSLLMRPRVANVDTALVIFAVRHPDPNLVLLDRMLVQMEQAGLEIVICFNKTDLAEEGDVEDLKRIYEPAGYPMIFTSVKQDIGREELLSALHGQLSVVAGPSGAGKSSLINSLAGKTVMETGKISKKIRRGKQTTRHTEIVSIAEDTTICDTPGFTSLDLSGIGAGELDGFFPEFVKPREQCRFAGCAHGPEPDCGVKEAVERKEIPKERYESFRKLYEELKEKESSY